MTKFENIVDNFKIICEEVSFKGTKDEIRDELVSKLTEANIEKSVYGDLYEILVEIKFKDGDVKVFHEGLKSLDKEVVEERVNLHLDRKDIDGSVEIIYTLGSFWYYKCNKKWGEIYNEKRLIHWCDFK